MLHCVVQHRFLRPNSSATKASGDLGQIIILQHQCKGIALHTLGRRRSTLTGPPVDVNSIVWTLTWINVEQIWVIMKNFVIRHCANADFRRHLRHHHHHQLYLV